MNQIFIWSSWHLREAKWYHSLMHAKCKARLISHSNSHHMLARLQIYVQLLQNSTEVYPLQPSYFAVTWAARWFQRQWWSTSASWRTFSSHKQTFKSSFCRCTYITPNQRKPNSWRQNNQVHPIIAATVGTLQPPKKYQPQLCVCRVQREYPHHVAIVVYLPSGCTQCWGHSNGRLPSKASQYTV